MYVDLSNASFMSNATVMVGSGDSFWLKPAVIVLLMQCSAVYVECLLLYPCCSDMSNVVCNVRSKSVFSNVLASVDIREIGCYLCLV